MLECCCDSEQSGLQACFIDWGSTSVLWDSCVYSMSVELKLGVQLRL